MTISVVYIKNCNYYECCCFNETVNSVGKQDVYYAQISNIALVHETSISVLFLIS